MICPKCKKGELILFKDIEVSHFFKITKGGKVRKHPYGKDKFDTERDYLECRNMMNCNQYFNYELDENGWVIKSSLTEQ